MYLTDFQCRLSAPDLCPGLCRLFAAHLCCRFALNLLPGLYRRFAPDLLPDRLRVLDHLLRDLYLSHHLILLYLLPFAYLHCLYRYVLLRLLPAGWQAPRVLHLTALPVCLSRPKLPGIQVLPDVFLHFGLRKSKFHPPLFRFVLYQALPLLAVYLS